VLEIGHRGRGASHHRRIEEPSPRREKPERDKPASDLEAPIGNVLVRHLVTRKVKHRADRESEDTRAEQRPGRPACRHVERNDHDPDDRVCSRPMGFFDQLRKMLQGPAHVQGGDDEGNVALHEDFGAGNAPEADIHRMETNIGGAVMPGISAQDAAETVEADFSEEAAPPDADP
jgi:hypothetical protein